MNEKTMTIHEALATLKTLDDRIMSGIDAITFCKSVRDSDEKIGGMTRDKFIDRNRSQYDSVNDLIAFRQAIRNAVSVSNATTTVVIGGKTYTVAEAIEMRKSGIQLKELILGQLRNQWNRANTETDRANDKVSATADQYVIGIMGSKEKSQSAEANAMRDAYIKVNTVSTVSTVDVQKEIDKLAQECGDFKAAVDSALSVSNAVTTITVKW